MAKLQTLRPTADFIKGRSDFPPRSRETCGCVEFPLNWLPGGTWRENGLIRIIAVFQMQLNYLLIDCILLCVYICDSKQIITLSAKYSGIIFFYYCYYLNILCPSLISFDLFLSKLINKYCKKSCKRKKKKNG